MHTAVLVHGDESLDGLGDAVDALSAQARERDDAVGGDRLPGEEQQLPVAQLDRVGAADELDACLVEQAADGLARVPPEQLERLGLRRDEADLDAVRVDRGTARRGHQGELVGR